MIKNDFKQLGHQTPYQYDKPEPALLEVFANPFADESQNIHQVAGKIHLEVPEFTTLCPITGQPDFALIVIDYQPDRLCVESKSLKVYLGRYRQEPVFHEACINKIANDLVSVLKPLYLKVEGRFTPRGGIPLWPSAEYTAESGQN